jgi:hypothetical protein
MAHTRFGKSLTVALAVLTRVATFPEKWSIVAPSEKKAKIIMGYIIDHTFDNDYTKQKLEISKDESLEHLRRERSKNRLTFKHTDGTMGEVFILSADSRNKQKAGDSLMGFGAPNIILDEAALIDDDIEAKIFRMLGDKVDNYYINIGNPFYRNHFLDKYRDAKYFKLNVDFQKGIEEGRLTQDFIDEAKKKPYFSVLYENKFPDADAIDAQGWSHLITDREYDNALAKVENRFGLPRLGHDVARGGGNFNTWVLRCDNCAVLLAKNEDGDLMSVTGTTVRLAKEHKVDWPALNIDDTGVGAGETDRLKEQGYRINSVKLGEQARDQTRFINRRAENYWKLKEWLNNGGKLDPETDWSELLDIKYKTDSSGRIKIMSKDEMRTNGIESPDVADGLMLSFDSIYSPRIKEKISKSKPKKFNKPYAMRMA